MTQTLGPDEQAIMDYLDEHVFGPILASPAASTKLKQPIYETYLYDGAGENPEAGLSAFIVRGQPEVVDALRGEIKLLLPGAVARTLG